MVDDLDDYIKNIFTWSEVIKRNGTIFSFRNEEQICQYSEWYACHDRPASHRKLGGFDIFVVSEDRSEFSFEDRFRLVQEGTKEFSNVKVLPSGKYVLSAVTFPEYFSK